jgi:hypothetical protein
MQLEQGPEAVQSLQRAVQEHQTAGGVCCPHHRLLEMWQGNHEPHWLSRIVSQLTALHLESSMQEAMQCINSTMHKYSAEYAFQEHHNHSSIVALQSKCNIVINIGFLLDWSLKVAYVLKTAAEE